MPTSRTLLVSLIVAAATSGASAQVLLYDVDFSSPLHTVGQPPTDGLGPAPRATPSAVTNGFTGLPRVVSTLGPLSDQPVELSPPEHITAENCYFDLLGPDGFQESFRAYEIEFDLVITEPGVFTSGFTLFADVPTVRPIRWRWDGFIQTNISDPFVGTWTVGELQHVRVRWDLDAHSYTLQINDALLATVPFDAQEILQLRISAGNNPAFEGPIFVAGVDNIRITGIPAPGAALVILAPLLLRRRRTLA